MNSQQLPIFAGDYVGLGAEIQISNFPVESQ